MESKQAIQPNNDIAHIFALFESALDRLQNELYQSKELHKLSVKTELISELENMLKNPLAAMAAGAQNIDRKLKEFVYKIFSASFFQLRSEIDSVFTRSDESSEITFAIVLKNDTSKIRGELFDTLLQYESMEYLSNRVPVLIQFVPVSLKDKLKNVTPLILEDVN